MLELGRFLCQRRRQGHPRRSRPRSYFAGPMDRQKSDHKTEAREAPDVRPRKARPSRSPCSRTSLNSNVIKIASKPNFDPKLEWAPWGGQLDLQELTGGPGFRRMKAHSQASHAHHRVQAPGRPGIPGRRGHRRAELSLTGSNGLSGAIYFVAGHHRSYSGDLESLKVAVLARK